MGSHGRTDFPRTPEEIHEDYEKRKTGLIRALTEDVDEFYNACNPEKENLCLYGMRDETWQVGPPAEEVPPELPEPCLGINFARDGMQQRDWLALVAVHSDSWLLAVAFFYAVKLDAQGRGRLFKMINAQPTLFEIVTNRKSITTGATVQPPFKRQKPLFWPDDHKWYLVEIQSVNPKAKQAKIVYASGEFEDVDLEEIVRDGHMALL
ncbi:hypothetical protein DUNSADRAFT_18585 [Dunaliella salina]|uniref:Alfin N-terminal domain-containing protein n=1 Tax=Dunaliella salina TaxID=3046 RepID=A0ABQ7FZV6_DUNSA|nr:hypothetical protein DUNSADRAFT_18585 [Dunaliella salina]|eukprot:KAF5827882.1 hypothetical protein DUNSADRAFT_18585 [Dunaliella salina]